MQEKSLELYKKKYLVFEVEKAKKIHRFSSVFNREKVGMPVKLQKIEAKLKCNILRFFNDFYGKICKFSIFCKNLFQLCNPCAK